MSAGEWAFVLTIALAVAALMAFVIRDAWQDGSEQVRPRRGGDRP